MPKPRNRVHDSPGCKITNPLWLPSGVGIQLQVSMELLIIELGLSAQPLQESFKKYGTRVTLRDHAELPAWHRYRTLPGRRLQWEVARDLAASNWLR